MIGKSVSTTNQPTESSINVKKIQNTAFLDNMHKILPWNSITSLIEGKYLTSSLGRSMIRAETMVRIYFVQLWYQLSDSEIEETLFFCKSVRDFAQLHQGVDLIPGKSEITQFRQLVEQQKLETVFSQTILSYINSSHGQPAT